MAMLLEPFKNSTCVIVPSLSVAVALRMMVAGATAFDGLAVRLTTGALLLMTLTVMGAVLAASFLLSVALAVTL